MSKKRKSLRSRDENWWTLKVLRRRIAARQNWHCHWCGLLMCSTPDCPLQVSLDHLVPVHAGGIARAGNVVAACRKCNSERHPEMNALKRQETVLIATSGETKTESPFAILTREISV